MGCVSSKLVKKKLVREIRVNNGGDHIVSLTSTTYGHLDVHERAETSPKLQELPKADVFESETIKPRRSSAQRDDPEVINTWELMEDLEDSMKISPKSRGIFGKSWKTPVKSRVESPKRNGSSKRFKGKENRGVSPKNILETPKRGVMRLSFPLKSEEPLVVTQRRKSFSPMFDPDLVASYERELSQEKEQIKMVISPAPNEKSRESERILESFPEKCPPGGENSVVVYITTLRGIRKTFEDCNAVRSILDSHEVRYLERDVSMHSVFKEEIRGIMGTKQVRVPAVFVKGRLIGSVEEVMKLEEKGKLGILLECMPKARLSGCCCGCGGMRFVMCGVCSGSCKVMDVEKKNTVKCLVCNENGLVLCPLCS